MQVLLLVFWVSKFYTYSVYIINEIKWNANLLQLGNFIDVFLARHASGT